MYRQTFKFGTNVESAFKQYVIFVVNYNGLTYLIAGDFDDIMRAKEAIILLLVTITFPRIVYLIYIIMDLL